MVSTATMAMSSDFLEAYARLPRPQQKGVRSLISKFNVDSTASGLNYERIHGARDRHMRSLRIDRGYRAIVLKPDRGDVHMLLWAAKHDDAYAWAERHECRINAETGALQVYEPQPAAPADLGAKGEDATPAAADRPSAFEDLRDRQLARLGVPAAMLEEVRAVRDDVELDAMQARLPLEAYEALFLYLAGESYERLVLEREAVREPVDTTDFEKALNRTDSQARFVVVDDEVELEAMLNAPLERWRVFLHPSQRRLVERNWNGPVRVLGGAGTGKTVVAMHRARWIARKSSNSGRILFTTFTRNLAADIENNLRSICTPDEMARIEVTNLDRWVIGFLRGRRYESRVIYGRHQESWELALDQKPQDLDYGNAFYRDEWERVVLANGVTTEEEYRRVPRVGRGTRLHRAARVKVWRVFEEYRAQLAERGLKEVDDAYRDAAALLEADPPALEYTTVIVDEAQDMGSQAYRLIRSMASPGADDLFIVGDGHQRIYGRNRVVLGRCGIEIRGRARKLRLNYRTTQQTWSWATGLLAGCSIDDLDGGVDDNHGIRSLTLGPEPQVRVFETRDEQTAALVEWLQALRERGEGLRSTCVVARTHKERNALAMSFGEHELPVFVLGADDLDDREREGVRLASMHRVKGLEFDRVAIASVNKGLVPLRAAVFARGDEAGRAAAETEERALVYVAATRAKKELLVLGFGEPSPFVTGP